MYIDFYIHIPQQISHAHCTGQVFDDGNGAEIRWQSLEVPAAAAAPRPMRLPARANRTVAAVLSTRLFVPLVANDSLRLEVSLSLSFSLSLSLSHTHTHTRTQATWAGVNALFPPARRGYVCTRMAGVFGHQVQANSGVCHATRGFEASSNRLPGVRILHSE